MKLNLKNIFLLDGGGAILSVGLSGMLLPFFSEWLGLTTSILYSMAAWALLCALYSLTCYKFVKLLKPGHLLVIILMNLGYGFFTGFVACCFRGITTGGRVVLIAEILVVLAVVAIELRVYRKAK